MLRSFQNLCEIDSFRFMTHLKKQGVLRILKGYVDIMNSTSLQSLNAHNVPGNVPCDREFVNQLIH